MTDDDGDHGHGRAASARPRDRLPGLDALRGLAALAVVAFHFTTRYGMIFGHPTPLAWSSPWGQRGVEVFFVISGFAIELSLASVGRARDFLIARALRLYPTFWAALAITLTVVWTFGLPERAVSVRDALLNVTMVPVSLGGRAADAVYWTLERELRFYGLVGALLALGAGRYTAHALVAATALQVLDAVSSVVPHFAADALNLGWTHLFACGALLARLRRDGSVSAAVALAACVLAGRALGPEQLAATAASVTLVWLSTLRAIGAHGSAALRAFVFLGRISYPLYLVHQYVGYVLMRALYARGAPPAIAISSAVALVLLAATLLHRAVEEPTLALLRRRRGTASPRG